MPGGKEVMAEQPVQVGFIATAQNGVAVAQAGLGVKQAPGFLRVVGFIRRMHGLQQGGTGWCIHAAMLPCRGVLVNDY